MKVMDSVTCRSIAHAIANMATQKFIALALFQFALSFENMSNSTKRDNGISKSYDAFHDFLILFNNNFVAQCFIDFPVWYTKQRPDGKQGDLLFPTTFVQRYSENFVFSIPTQLKFAEQFIRDSINKFFDSFPRAFNEQYQHLAAQALCTPKLLSKFAKQNQMRHDRELQQQWRDLELLRQQDYLVLLQQKKDNKIAYEKTLINAIAAQDFYDNQAEIFASYVRWWEWNKRQLSRQV